MAYCEYCGDEIESDDYDLDQFDHKHYLCSKTTCQREFHRDCQAVDEERRHRAEEDGYSRY